MCSQKVTQSTPCHAVTIMYVNANVMCPQKVTQSTPCRAVSIMYVNANMCSTVAMLCSTVAPLVSYIIMTLSTLILYRFIMIQWQNMYGCKYVQPECSNATWLINN